MYRMYWWRVFWRSAQELLFVRLLRVAKLCDECKRILPIEWKDVAKHLWFRGSPPLRVFLCDRCGARESILDRWFEPLYGDDDWDDYYGAYTDATE